MIIKRLITQRLVPRTTLLRASLLLVRIRISWLTAELTNVLLERLNDLVAGLFVLPLPEKTFLHLLLLHQCGANTYFSGYFFWTKG